MASLVSLFSEVIQVYANQNIARKSGSWLCRMLMTLAAGTLIIAGCVFCVFALYLYLKPILGTIYTRLMIGGGFLGLGLLLMLVLHVRKPKKTSLNNLTSSLTVVEPLLKSLNLPELKRSAAIKTMISLGILAWVFVRLKKN